MTSLRDNVFSQYLSTTSRLTIMVDSMVIPFHDYLSKHSSEYEFKQTTKFYCQKNSDNTIYQVNLSFLKLSRFTSSSPTDTLQKLYLGMKAKAPGGQRACGKVHYSLPPPHAQLSYLDYQLDCSFCRAVLQDHVSGCN